MPKPRTGKYTDTQRRKRRIAAYAVLLALAVPACSAGAQIADGLFRNGVTVSAESVEPLPMLLSAMLSPILYGLAVYLGGKRPYTLVLWGAAVAGEWLSVGCTLGVLRILGRNGCAKNAVLVAAVALMLRTLLTVLLALATFLPERRNDPFSVGNAERELMRVVVPTLCAAFVETLAASVLYRLL